MGASCREPFSVARGVIISFAIAIEWLSRTAKAKMQNCIHEFPATPNSWNDLSAMPQLEPSTVRSFRTIELSACGTEQVGPGLRKSTTSLVKCIGCVSGQLSTHVTASNAATVPPDPLHMDGGMTEIGKTERQNVTFWMSLIK